MTLDDLERLNVTLAQINKIYGAHQNNCNEDRPIVSAAKCRPLIVTSIQTERKIFISVLVPQHRTEMRSRNF